MIILLYLSVIVVFIILILFAFPRFSPIPYFPSNAKDMNLIVKALQLKNGQTIIDLGAGDGAVVFAAAKDAFRQHLTTRFVAVDINPVLILIMYTKWLFHPNRSNIQIIRDDIFKMQLNDGAMKDLNNVTIYLYISPWYIEKVILNLKSHPPAGGANFDVVSYMYRIKGARKKEKIIKGVRHDIFRYNGI